MPTPLVKSSFILLKSIVVLSIIYQSSLFFIFLHVHTRRRGEIQTSDLRFMRRSPQPIELPIGNKINSNLSWYKSIGLEFESYLPHSYLISIKCFTCCVSLIKKEFEPIRKEEC
jgi:hypothetical protein